MGQDNEERNNGNPHPYRHHWGLGGEQGKLFKIRQFVVWFIS